MSKRNFLVSLDLNRNELLNPVLHNQTSHPSVAGSSGYTYFNTVDRTVYSYAPGNPNSVADWLNLGLPEGAGITDLTYTASTRTLYSSTGADVILPLADGTNAGLMTSAYFTALSATTGTNTGDQTSIVGITGTKAQFDTALTDGNFLYVGDADNYVSWDLYSDGVLRSPIIKNENVNFVGGTGISIPYTTTLDNTLTINHTNSVTAGTASGGSGAIAYGGSFTIPTITYDAQGHITTTGTTSYTLPSAYSFDVQGNGGTEINITTGENLNFINGSGTSAVVVNQTNPTVTFNINANGVTNAMLATMGANTVKGNPTSSTATPTDISLNTNSVLGRFTGDTTNIIIDNDLSAVSTLHDQLASSLAIKNYIDSSVAGQLVYQGGYNAGTNTPNLETPVGGAVNKGFTYTVTVSGDFFTEAVQIGDVLISEVDNPSTLADWTVVNKNIPDIVDASEIAKGLVEEATQIETQAGTAVGGTGARLYVNPTKLAAWSGTTNLYPTVRNGISLTTIGTSGAATYTPATGVFNIPNYANTTYSAATSTVLGLTKLFSDTVQSVAATAVSTTASRTYGIQFNGSGQMVVNVPWTDTSTINKYVGLLSGATTSHAVTHGLGQQYVTAQVFDAGTNEMVECEVVLTSSSITTFNFNVATTANQYRVVIIG